MDLFWIFPILFSFASVKAIKERQITSSFCYGFVENWIVPNPAHVNLECNENEVIEVESVEFKRPNKVGDDDIISVDPNACSRDHRLGADQCLARHRFDSEKADLERRCNLEQSCRETVPIIFMHLSYLKGGINCNSLQNCNEINKTCFARRVDVTYKCKRSLLIGGSQTTPLQHPVGVTKGATTTRTILKVTTPQAEAELATLTTYKETSKSNQCEANTTGIPISTKLSRILLNRSCKLVLFQVL